MMPDERDWTRREILQTAAAGSLASSLCRPGCSAQDKNAADPERIRRENDDARHPRLDDDQRACRSQDQVPLPLDRRLRVEDERPARGIDHAARQHQPARHPF